MKIRQRLTPLLVLIPFLCSLLGAQVRSWSLLYPSGSLPGARDNAASAYSPASNRLIVFGGDPHTTAYTNDLWILTDANGLGTPTWTQAIPPNAVGSPPARAGASMVYDAATNRA